MDANNVFEFWVTLENGEKINKFITTRTEKEEEVKKMIADKYKFDMDKVTDFTIKNFN